MDHEIAPLKARLCAEAKYWQLKSKLTGQKQMDTQCQEQLEPCIRIQGECCTEIVGPQPQVTLLRERDLEMLTEKQ